jgi:hypothetical protein
LVEQLPAFLERNRHALPIGYLEAQCRVDCGDLRSTFDYASFELVPSLAELTVYLCELLGTLGNALFQFAVQSGKLVSARPPPGQVE